MTTPVWVITSTTESIGEDGSVTINHAVLAVAPTESAAEDFLYSQVPYISRDVIDTRIQEAVVIGR